MYDMLFLNIMRECGTNTAFLDCIGQHSIASYIGMRGFSGKVYSGDAHTVKRVVEQAVTLHGIKAVGLYASADNQFLVKHIAVWIKQQYGIRVLVGGPQSVAFGEDFLRETGCDAVVDSEGEEPIYRLLDHYINGNGSLASIPNIKYIDDGQYKKNPVTYYVEDLDSIPYPSFDNSLNKRFRKGGFIGIITGRGCPNRCSFCYEGANAKHVRFRSVENVCAEIDYVIQNNPKAEVVNFYDDTFTLDEVRVQRFCEEMKKRGLIWLCEGHIANILRKPEMIKEMVQSGLCGMQIGIESGSAKVLEAYRKNITPEDIIRTVDICKAAGLSSLAGNFIIGGAFETRETFNDSLGLAKKMIEHGRGMFECRSVYLSPYPNTAISNDPASFGLHIDEQADEKTLYTMNNPIMYTDALSIDEIIDLHSFFEEEISKKYKEQALLCSKYDVINGLRHSGKLANRLYTWYSFYTQYEHLDTFIKIGMRDHELYHEEFFPIRTFNDPTYADGFNLTDIDKRFLMYANGRYSIADISEKLCLTKIQIRKIYERLNIRCFVCMSEF